MNCKINLGDRLLLLNGTNSIVDLLVATVLGGGDMFGVHGCGDRRWLSEVPKKWRKEK